MNITHIVEASKASNPLKALKSFLARNGETVDDGNTSYDIHVWGDQDLPEMIEISWSPDDNEITVTLYNSKNDEVDHESVMIQRDQISSNEMAQALKIVRRMFRSAELK